MEMVEEDLACDQKTEFDQGDIELLITAVSD